MGRQVQYARNGEINIAYEVRGEGPLDVMLVLPWFSNLDVLDSYAPIAKGIDRFSSFGRLILHDRRGSGLSDRMCGHATMEEGIDDLLAVIDAVGSEQVALFGLNESGSLCALAAATRPDRISSLILYGSFATTQWQPDYPWAPRPEERQQEVDFLIETWGTEGFARAINPLAKDEPELLDWAARFMRSSVSKDALPRAYDILSKSDVRHVLPTIKVPTLVLHRDNDPVVPVDNARYLAEHIPDAKLVVLEGNQHLPFLGDSDAVADEVEEFLTGHRPDHHEERVLATILIADIVGSSGKATSLGDARWRDLLDRLEQMVEVELSRFQGRLVKTTGDGFLATFDGPARAIRCASTIAQRAEELGLPLRSGVHTGEVERHRDDVVGIAVHIAARVAALAEGSEVLVSGAVPPLVAGAGIEFDDRGMHELRGIDGKWQVLSIKP
jgi:pimeloyl-ACP methyl ester carboxylesterase